MIYKVIAGAFKLKENAEKRKAMLQSNGIEADIYSVNRAHETLYRVHAGAFSTREMAEKRLAEVKKNGVPDAYFFLEKKGSSPTSVSILGKSILSSKQMQAFVKSKNPFALRLETMYLSFAESYGIRGDIAFAQALLETNYLRFTGVVRAEQNNFAGIGATNRSTLGASFSTPQVGVLAHLQHLYAYATNKPLPPKHPLVDPRFHLVSRGSASTWVALNGKWAVPGEEYGQSILRIYHQMAGYSPK
ncbi:glucosaminidase domain-containing protein [Mesobacillus maritimus]|uniref:SPOR domain-containing protein n=1 Tax=Mesobacillus maritimus TaxID=1643336 RepID=UPI00203A6A7D|nr:SPOR domain-containing protein [Mesobacillus maritimus]MCM3670598.1 glucosaminidase domain-containing protein [Mesobacillus maritimus]